MARLHDPSRGQVSAFLFTLLVLILTASTVVPSAPNPLLTQLEAELRGRTFKTKLVLGSAWRYYNEQAQRELTRLIDTEIDATGNIDYLVRRGHVEGFDLLAPNFYIKPEKMSSTLPVGSRVIVRNVEVMGDRVELHLAGYPDESYAKMKLMLGKNYQKNLGFEGVMTAVAKALHLEAYERVGALKTEYASLKDKLTRAETAAAAPGQTATGRVESSKALQAALRALATNREEWASLRPGEGDEAADYKRRADGLDEVIRSLSAEANAERVAAVKRLIAAGSEEAARLASDLRGAQPKTRADLDTRLGFLKRFDEILSHRRALHDELVGLGSPPDASERDGLLSDMKESQSLRDSLNRSSQGLELIDLNSEYGAMEKKLSQLMDAYTRAFGSPAQRVDAERVLAQLARMRDNRLTAQKLGAPNAAAQAARHSKEIDRIKRQQQS